MSFLESLGLMGKNISTFGYDLDYLIYLISLIVIPIALLTLVVLFLLIWQGIRNKESAYISGKGGYLVIGLFIIDFIVLVFDLVIFKETLKPWSKIQGRIYQNHSGDWVFPDKTMAQDDVYQIKVLAKQFSWSFYYPGQDGILNTEDDIYQNYALHIPVNKRIILHLTSRDVIHSFWVPSLRFKQDTIPGRLIKRWFQIDPNQVNHVDFNIPIDIDPIYKYSMEYQGIRAKMFNLRRSEDEKDKKELLKNKIRMIFLKDKLKDLYRKNRYGERIYEIICAEICGNSHYSMNGWLVLQSEENFNAWVKDKIEKMQNDLLPF